MTPVPPPASPCLRVRLDYTQSDGYKSGNRFFLSYAGAAPTAGNCVTLASDIRSAWVSALAPLTTSDTALTEVDVLDIATDLGFSGVYTGSDPGSNGGTSQPSQLCTNVEFDIQRRYRGGKPRIFLPGPPTSAILDAGHWTTTWVGDINTAVASFFTTIEALSVGAVGTLAHVNLSYYKGFTNVTNSSGRERAVPTYRTAALVDTVTGYATKSLIGSQKRRRAASAY